MPKNVIMGTVAAVVIVGGAFLLFKKPAPLNTAAPVQQQPAMSNTNTVAPTVAPTQVQPKPSSTKPASGVQTKKPAATPQILGVQMSAGLSSTGAALKPSSVFSPATPTIYAVLNLKNVTQRTQLSYIRSYEGKYVDSKVSHPSKDGAEYFHFDWALKVGKTRKVGNYSLVFYIDGSKAQTVKYSIR